MQDRLTGAPLLDLGQRNAETQVNEAVLRLAAVSCGVVDAVSLSTLPVAPTAPYLGILLETAPDYPNYICYFWDTSWLYIAPRSGLRFFNRDDSKYYSFNGTKWVADIRPNFLNLPLNYSDPIVPGTTTDAYLFHRNAKGKFYLKYADGIVYEFTGVMVPTV